jgi:hypothetical protein
MSGATAGYGVHQQPSPYGAHDHYHRRQVGQGSGPGGPVVHILDCWHISTRVRYAEQALQGIYAFEPEHRAGLDMAAIRTDRLRHLLWNGYHQVARRELVGLRHLAEEAALLNGQGLLPSVDRFLWHCDELRGYLANNETALIDYGARFRGGLPVSTSRADGCVDEIANARMAKRQRMRWSPRGAHRLALVRAAVLDGRLNLNSGFRNAAWRPGSFTFHPSTGEKAPGGTAIPVVDRPEHISNVASFNSSGTLG